MTVIAYLYPRRTTCPHCRHVGHEHAGARGRVRHRRCTACGCTYKVLPHAIEVDRGGDQSEIVPY